MILIFIWCSWMPLFSQSLPRVLIKTEIGKIILELDTINAPVTAKNFLNLVKCGVYINSTFYRSVKVDNQAASPIKIEVIQGGLYDEKEIEKFKPIRHETTSETRIRHSNGVVSMARSGPGTASTEFFICIGNQPELDFGGKRNPDGQGFAAFGKVIKGMDVVKAIQQQKDSLQYLTKPIKILKAVSLK